jgi:hypothetical protein
MYRVEYSVMKHGKEIDESSDSAPPVAIFSFDCTPGRAYFYLIFYFLISRKYPSVEAMEYDWAAINVLLQLPRFWAPRAE